ncbi:hypothetical protein HaLaN_21451, partial [Haematococcus lacustris]
GTGSTAAGGDAGQLAKRQQGKTSSPSVYLDHSLGSAAVVGGESGSDWAQPGAPSPTKTTTRHRPLL